MLELQPTIIGPYITLRPLEEQDFSALFAAASDPATWAQHPDPSRGTREGFPVFFEGALNSRSCLIAIDVARQLIIGCSRYSNYMPGERITIGYTFLSPRYWGGAANAEMKRLMLHHAFTDVREVRFTVAEQNFRSLRAVEKLGAEFVGFESAARWGQNHLIYRLTPQLWEKRAAIGYGPSSVAFTY